MENKFEKYVVGDVVILAKKSPGGKFYEVVMNGFEKMAVRAEVFKNIATRVVESPSEILKIIQPPTGVEDGNRKGS